MNCVDNSITNDTRIGVFKSMVWLGNFNVTWDFVVVPIISCNRFKYMWGFYKIDLIRCEWLVHANLAVMTILLSYVFSDIVAGSTKHFFLSGFETLAKRLKLQDVRNTKVYHELLRVCYKELMTVIPSQLTPHLIQKDILSWVWQSTLFITVV